MATDSVQMQIDGLRRKLLDLSMRNRMLNFRPSKRLGIAVIGEDSDQVHRTLVDDGRKMVFIGKPDAPKRPRAAYDLPPLFDDPVAQEEFRQEAIEELESHLNHPYSTVDQTDTRLNTDEPHSLLETKLRTVAREASLAAEELGIDTLFLTLGMLEWREPGADRAYGAPLLFVPVSLERQKHGTLRLVHSGGDVGDNLPLRAKLRELGVELPSYNDEEGARLYFDSVRSALRKRGDWAVMPNEIALGFFNYEKYAMYVDLGGDAWPEDRKPWVHPDLTAILSRGFPPGASSIGEETFLDDVRPPATSYEVYDADSSQTLAMIRAADGLSMVVEGPPGTGKSQTITNIIAQAVQAGKTVLFVSAKRAALEVVRRKLNEADLGDICLDLHDKFSNRRQFYAELKRTAERAVSAPSAQERVTRLTELRDRLNTYVIAVNEPLDEYECTPFQAISRLAALPPETAEDRAGRVVFARLRQWTDAEVRKRLPLVQALQNQVRELGAPPDQHAFSGVGIEFLDPGVQLDLREDLASALQTLERALAAIAGAAAAFGIPRPPCRAQLVTLSRCLDRVVNAPAIDGLAVASEVWLAEEARFRSVIDAIRQRADCRSRRGTQLLPTAWEIDWTPELQAYEQRAQQWRRLFSRDFRRARRRLAENSTADAPRSAIEQLELLRDLGRERESSAAIAEAGESLAPLFGPAWRGVDSDPDRLACLLCWTVSLHHDAARGDVPTELVYYFAAEAAGATAPPRLRRDDPRLPALVAEAQANVDDAVRQYDVIAARLRVSPLGDSEALAAAAERVQRWLEALDALPAYLRYANVQRQALEQGLDAVVEVAATWPLGGERLRDGYLRSYYSGMLREAVAQRPALGTFDRAAHEAAIAEYRDLDDFKLTYNRALVRLAHQDRMPRFSLAAGNLAILRGQCELQRRHKPIRWIMARAGEAIMRIKPVFMMSPLSAAIHIPPECPPFDLVIFDEASQVRPEDALCAIARGRQTIVVGDTRQMPPSSFFDRVAADEEDLDDDAPDDEKALGEIARQQESILSLMTAAAGDRTRRPDLRWHYRSLHPALIQPSNQMFYDSRLVIFPSSGHMATRRAGIVFHHLPDTTYEGGARSRLNRGEAEHVVRAVLAHLRECPAESLMVAAMNKPQADLIFDLLSQQESNEPGLFQHFRARHPHEPLDVKNLEMR